MKRSRVAVAVAVTTAALAAGGLAGPGASAGPGDDGPEPARLSKAPAKLVVVHAQNRAERNELVALGLDTTTRVTARGLHVILHGRRDARVLRAAGFSWTVKVRDLGVAAREDRRADRRYADRVAESDLPSGSTRYRTLPEVNAELAQLATDHPRLVRPITLHNRTTEGRLVRGIEITTQPNQLGDGKPVFLLMGAHHAREWPSVEHAMEYAYDLLESYTGGGDPRAERIVEGSRTIVVPVVNPDGFHVSRSAVRIGDFSLFDYEMKRKTCSISENTPAQYTVGSCDDNPAGRLRGTDPNRNYPGFWGGPGASTEWSSDTYRGDSPGSEPEVDNVRRLVSNRQVVSLISLHTYSNLVLRPPGVAATGEPVDEPLYEALGARLAGPNGYTNQPSYQLYDTTGSTEDWTYWIAGGLGFTFEIGTLGFHPRYDDGVVAEYLGREPAAGAGRGGNRESLYRMSMATLRPALHSTIEGRAPAGHRLKISKQFISPTSPVIDEEGNEGDPLYFEDTLVSRYRSDGGTFTWAVNPSTRPLVAGRYGREPQAPPQEGEDLVNPPGVPAEGESEQTTFTVEGLPEVDNGFANIRVEWPDDAVDWDVYVLGPDGEPVGSAASLANPEVARIPDPAPGEYTVVVENYEGGTAAQDWTGSVDFDSPTPPQPGFKEAWTFSCVEIATGDVVSTQGVVVDRGETVDVGAACRPEEAKRR